MNDAAPASEHTPVVFETAKSTADAKPEGKPVPVKQADKLKLRAERFKDPEVEKSKARAARFNLVHPDIEKEKNLKRAERFGLTHPELEDQKKKIRADRFGIVDVETQLEARKDRFKPLPKALSVAKAVPINASDVEARKKARAERFGL